MQTVQLAVASQTHALGVRLGAAAFPGMVVTLRGDLGAGKTVLAKGIGAGLGVPGIVRSPTFVILQLHEGGRLPMAHVDGYRLDGPDDLAHVGLDDALAGHGVVVIEWPERFEEALPVDRLDIALDFVGTARRATLRATGPQHVTLEDEHG